jgi:hypothetical protein
MMNKEDKKKIEKACRRVWELEKGKTVLVEFAKQGEGIRVDYRCLGKDTDACNECSLRFKCYSSQYLIIDSKDLDLSIDVTINEAVERYIKGHRNAKSTS